MKKAALIIGSLFAVFTLGACEADDQEDLNEQIEALEEQIETMHTEVVERDETIESLEEEIAILTVQKGLMALEGNFDTLKDDSTLDHTLFFGLHHLGALQSDDAIIDPDEAESSGELINAIFTQRGLNADTLEYEEALLEQADTEWLYPASLQVLALQDASLDLESFHNEYINSIDGDTLDAHDVDSLAMAYFALDSLGEDDLREQIALLMEEAPSEFPYSDNAASHAHRVMVLAHANELEVAHVQSLVNYQLESGMFAYEIDDDAPDTVFSTPQALLALAYAQQTIDGFDGHPFETDAPIEQD